jgi:ABC-type branched-subunit amino acid transport system ATPase component
MGVTIIWVEHLGVTRIVDRVIVLDHGERY